MKTYLIAALVLTPFAVAADPLPKQVENMECLIGSWKGSGTIAMGKDKAKIDAALDCKRTSAKFGVLCSFHVTGVPGMAAYEETDLFGYEPNTDTYHWYSVTNAGETHDHVAKPPTGERIDFVYTGTQEGKPLKEAIVLDFAKDGKSVTARNETTVGGAPAASLDIKLRK
jgi:hypothetical protein